MLRWLTALIIVLSAVLLKPFQGVLPQGVLPNGGLLHGNGAPDDGLLTVTFLDVGQGDAAVIQCGEHAMLIDGGDSQRSALLYSFLRQNGIRHLDYLVNSHPHEDHVGGMAAALNFASAGRIFCPEPDYDSPGLMNLRKYAALKGTSIEVPELGKDYRLGSAVFRFLGPLRSAEDLNDRSLVLFLEYGKTSFLFTGDMEWEEEQSLLEAGVLRKATVLKAAHHGSGTSTGQRFLSAVRPAYAVISVGADNAYGHPHRGTLKRLKEAGAEIFRTDQRGSIVCESDGETVSFRPEREETAETAGTAGTAETAGTAGTAGTTGTAGDHGTAGTGDASSWDPEGILEALREDGYEGDTFYVLNVKSFKFHRPSCEAVLKMREKNREISVKSRDELLKDGFDPCGFCRP